MAEEKKVELTDEELDKASGGYVPNYGFHINKYAASNYIGCEIYLMEDDSNWGCWLRGKLIRSWEDSYGCGTKRRHTIEVHQTCFWGDPSDYKGNRATPGQTQTFEGDDHTMYYAPSYN